MTTALWIGDADLPEFAPAAAVLRKHGQLTVVPHVADALRCESAADWTAVVVAEALPGERWSEAVDELRRRRPNLPIVRLVGPGCDGELRSRPPATVHRYLWLEAPAAFQRDCDLLERGECPSWGRPVTQGPEERLLDATIDVTTPSLVGIRVDVLAHDPATVAWLIDLVRAAGGQAASFNEAGGIASAVDVVLWQVPDDPRAAAAGELRLRQARSQSAFVACVAFPRVEQVSRLKAAGMDRIVALPALPQAVESAIAAVVAAGRAS
jgi:hypothetical protein